MLEVKTSGGKKVNTKTSSKNPAFWIIATVLIILALVLPFAYRVDTGPGPDSIQAMTWDYIKSSWYTGFRFWNLLDTIPYTLLRFVFAVYLARLWFGRTSTHNTIIIGILAELQPLLVSAPLVYLIDWPGDSLVPLYLPLPIMFFIGVVIIVLNRLNRSQA